jgi:hypothetical protein
MYILKIADNGQQMIHTKEKLKEIIEHPIPAIYRREIKTVFNNLSIRCQTILKAKGDHFQNLLQCIW